MQRRPITPLAAVVIVLALLSLPVSGMRLGFADAGSEAPMLTTRQAYYLVADGFGPGFNAPLVLVSGGDEGAARAATTAVDALDEVAQVTPAQRIGTGLWLSLVMGRAGPQDEATADLVRLLRSRVLPTVADRTGATYLVGGSTAAALPPVPGSCPRT